MNKKGKLPLRPKKIKNQDNLGWMISYNTVYILLL